MAAWSSRGIGWARGSWAKPSVFLAKELGGQRTHCEDGRVTPQPLSGTAFLAVQRRLFHAAVRKFPVQNAKGSQVSPAAEEEGGHWLPLSENEANAWKRKIGAAEVPRAAARLFSPSHTQRAWEGGLELRGGGLWAMSLGCFRGRKGRGSPPPGGSVVGGESGEKAQYILLVCMQRNFCCMQHALVDLV